jgi:hypothetical protein
MEIRLVQTKEDREAVYRFRYQIYVELKKIHSPFWRDCETVYGHQDIQRCQFFSSGSPSKFGNNRRDRRPDAGDRLATTGSQKTAGRPLSSLGWEG